MMKFDKVVKTYLLEDVSKEFSEWLKTSKVQIETVASRRYDPETDTWQDDPNLEILEIEDSAVLNAVREFEKWYQKNLEKMAELAAKEQAQKEAEQKKRQQELSSIMITSGFAFEGYSITKYSGYISGDDVIQIDRGREGFFARATDVGAALMESLVDIRRNALLELKEAALALGCNAIIGVDFDYLVLDPETVNSQGGTLYMPYVFGVTANGNAVVIEKAKRKS